MRVLSVVAVLVLACAIAPQQAVAGSWSVKTSNWVTIGAAVAFVDDQHGFAPVGINGQGAAIWVTSDGGDSWTTAPAPTAAMYLGGSAQKGSAVAGGLFELIYSDSGSTTSYNFSSSSGVLMSATQSIEAFEGTSYGATGQGLTGNGVAVSTDNGRTFSFSNISVAVTSTRYGAFPSASTWYISAGQWPNRKTGDLSRRLRLVMDEDDTVPHVSFVENKAMGNGSGNGWDAQILKTTDGGQTWTSVFHQPGSFYFNQIACGSETECVAVGESDDGPAPGIRIYATSDGGSTWKRTYFNPDGQFSLMAARHVSGSEYWVGGGHLSSTDFAGYFFHTTDGGATWTNSTVPGVYTASISFPDADHGFATAFNVYDTTSFLTFA